VAYGNVVTLWGPELNKFRVKLSHPEEDIVSLQFLCGSPFLLMTTEHRLYLWNLLSCSVEWLMDISCPLLVTDPYSNSFLVSFRLSSNGSDSSVIALFEGSSMRPKCFWKTTSSEICLDMAFLPPHPDEEGRSFTFIDNFRIFHTFSFGSGADLESDHDLTRLFGSTTYSLLRLTGLANIPKEQDSDSFLEMKERPETKFIDSIFSGPSHALPAPSVVFQTFMDGLVKKKEESKH